MIRTGTWTYHSGFSGTLLRLEEDRLVLTAAWAEFVRSGKLERGKKGSQYIAECSGSFKSKFVGVELRWVESRISQQTQNVSSQTAQAIGTPQ